MLKILQAMLQRTLTVNFHMLKLCLGKTEESGIKHGSPALEAESLPTKLHTSKVILKILQARIQE